MSLGGGDLKRFDQGGSRLGHAPYVYTYREKTPVEIPLLVCVALRSLEFLNEHIMLL